MRAKTILITGGTGSFGNAFVDQTLRKFSPKKIIIFSRDEMKQWNMAQRFKNEDRIRFFIGDVRDKERLLRAFHSVDIVIHAAATKIVPTAEYNPFECVKTNIIGAMNVIDAAIDNAVKKVVALSTDKASSPINIYGASKLVSDKIFIAGNAYSVKKQPICSIVRYGNVIGSRGSVIPLFAEQAKTGQMTVTDAKMTRFLIDLQQAVEMVWKASDEAFGGEIFVKKIPSVRIMDLAKIISPNAKIVISGMRPGEKLHEELISKDEANLTYDFLDHYRILPSINDWHLDPRRIGQGEKVDRDFSYTSENNAEWISLPALKNWIDTELSNSLPTS